MDKYTIADSAFTVPTSIMTKAEIKAYMDGKGIAYNSGDTKLELLTKIGNAESN